MLGWIVSLATDHVGLHDLFALFLMVDKCVDISLHKQITNVEYILLRYSEIFNVSVGL